MVHKQQLIIFTRYPEAGKTKTRLIPHLGAEGAALFQKSMTEYTLRQALITGVSVEVRFTGGSREQMHGWLGDDLSYAEQGDGDLGQRMHRAFTEHTNAGAAHVVILGSDCPSNSWRNIRKAFEGLIENECVIGPANDGGYYLIGLSRPAPKLFKNIDWGGTQVFEQTINAAAGLSIHQLPKRDDVDIQEDIPLKITVIIPTLNEEEHLEATLEKIDSGFHVERVIVDGGSTDSTRLSAPDCMTCLQGRAAQQNAGAETATGQLFLFLHADTELPDGWEWSVREALADPAVSLGAFSLKIREAIRGVGFIEYMANWRSRKKQLPYGDQALFMRRETFHQVGGFPDRPIMEDYALVRSLRRVGRVVTVPEVVITSGRRWQKHGVLKVTMINWLMVLGYHLGVDSATLAKLYRRS